MSHETQDIIIAALITRTNGGTISWRNASPPGHIPTLVADHVGHHLQLHHEEAGTRLTVQHPGGLQALRSTNPSTATLTALASRQLTDKVALQWAVNDILGNTNAGAEPHQELMDAITAAALRDTEAEDLHRSAGHRPAQDHHYWTQAGNAALLVQYDGQSWSLTALPTVSNPRTRETQQEQQDCSSRPTRNGSRNRSPAKAKGQPDSLRHTPNQPGHQRKNLGRQHITPEH